MKTKQEIKQYFENGDIPTQEQFWEWQDSYWHKNEQIPSNKVDIDLSQKADLIGGKVPASQLPGYVDDVLEFGSFSSLPAEGESGKIYITTDNNKLFRWTGTRYVDITQGDVGTLQTVTEKGKDTSENIKVQGISFGGLGNADNIIIGDDSSFVNNHAGGTIAIGKNTKPEGTDHLVIGNTASANNAMGSIGNTVVGNFAMMQAPNSSENAVFGYNSLSNAKNAFANVVFGTYSGLFSGDSLTQNTILGYYAGIGLGTDSSNNVIIGSNSGFANYTLKNKLYIHSSTSGGTKTISEALISGDFSDRNLNINGKFSITPGQIPSGDSSFTKNIVAKPDGTFGWENKMNCIPLTGTESGNPVTGNISIYNNGNYTMLDAGNIVCSNSSDTAVNITNTAVQFFDTSLEAVTISQSGITSKNLNYVIDCREYGARGLTGASDYTQNLENLDYVQKVYVDKKQSYSTTEVKTGGTWINGKPIYKKTIVFDTIPLSGEIDITADFRDLEAIVSNQMFTEWWAMDIAFAGNQWMTKAFITLQTDMVRIELVNETDYDYSLINSFTLTLEYTKKTD